MRQATPAKPSIIIAQTEGSGVAAASEESRKELPTAEKVELPKTIALQPPIDWQEAMKASPNIVMTPAAVTCA